MEDRHSILAGREEVTPLDPVKRNEIKTMRHMDQVRVGWVKHQFLVAMQVEFCA